MARNKKRRNNPKLDTEENIEPIIENIEQTQKDAEITEEELQSQNVQIDSNQIKVRNVKNAFEKVTKMLNVLEQRDKEKKELLDKLQEEKRAYEIKKDELSQKIADYDKELKEINELRIGSFSNIIDKKIIDRYSESINEQAEILMEEIKNLKKQQTEYLQRIAEKEKKILKKREELKIKKIALEEEFHQKFDAKEDMLKAKETKLKKLQEQIEIEREDFEEEKNYLEEKARKTVENEISLLESQIDLWEKKNQALSEEINTLKEIERSFGGRDPQKVIVDLVKAEDKIYELQNILELKPDNLKIEELKKLRQEKIEWQTKLEEALADANDYKRRWEKEQISIGEKETLEFQKEELQNRIKLQQRALEEFKQVLEKSSADKVFSSCNDMDNNYSEADNVSYPQRKLSGKWLNILQQQLANREIPLYYDKNILRAFVSGLAMSRLTILQGISGTGKTSLPESFAQAIGGEYVTIEVQSGWKDRQDLIGYYNTFEKKFYETEFLKALYKANTPKYRNKPFFIILDEMNLSHPEHYFADFLSLMEKTDFEKQKLKICDRVNDKPDQLIDEDATFKLQIPDNVWFIGTANHDETTMQFAPKTYDRSNVIEMPKSHTEIEKEPEIDFESLKIDNQNFLNNLDNLSSDYSMIKVENYLRPDGSFNKVCSEMGIGWGNRLEKQMKKFIPVFKALGGTESDAFDHILASKILRNIQGRYDLSESILNKMKKELEENYSTKFESAPRKSIEIIDDELKKK